MAATVRDWQAKGVTLKVELATTGELVVGGNQTDISFVTGGINGAPVNWTAGEYPTPGSNVGLYNFTTALGLFSVSVKAVPSVARQAGIWSDPFPITPGYRYQIGCQAQLMDGKAASVRTVTLETTANGTSWLPLATSASQTAVSPWETILVTSASPTSRSIARIQLHGGCTSGTLGLWGTQFRDLFVRQVHNTPEPLVWHDVTCDVQAIDIRYGREKFTNRYDVATMQIELLNNLGQYSFHQPHPLNLRPGRQVRVTATYEGIDYPLAFHILDSITDAYGMDGSVISRWQCVDPTTVLSNVETATNAAPGVQGGGRIALLLDQIGYVPRLLDNGVWNMAPIKSSGRTLRDECGLTGDSEGGQFFADRLGQVVYKDRTWPDVDPDLMEVTADLVGFPHDGPVMPIVDAVPTQAGAPLICINELVTDWSMARVVNLVSLANAGGTAQVFEDEVSIKAHGPQTYQRHDFVLMTDEHLPDRAADIMTGYADPVLRFNSVRFAPGMAGAWPWTLGLFLNWLVRVWYTHPTNYWGYACCVHVQSIEHRISPNDWETTLTVDLPESFTEMEWATTWGWDEGIWDEDIWDQIAESHGALWDDGYTWSNPASKWGP